MGAITKWLIFALTTGTPKIVFTLLYIDGKRCVRSANGGTHDVLSFLTVAVEPLVFTLASKDGTGDRDKNVELHYNFQRALDHRDNPQSCEVE